jgi:flagellar hook-associated protein 3 FlgL
MSITGPGSINAANLAAQTNIFNQLNKLSLQLGTGEVSQTYAGLGPQAGVALSLSSQLAALSGYSTTATTVGTTLTLAQSVLTQLGDASTAVQQSVNKQNAFTLSNNGQTSTQQSAAGYLDQILSLLNTQAGDTYMFSGEAVNTPSVASSSAILNGNGSQAGLTQVMAERLQADQGASGLGRLVIPPASGSTVSISEDVAGSPFGLKLGSVSSSLTGATRDRSVRLAGVDLGCARLQSECR